MEEQHPLLLELVLVDVFKNVSLWNRSTALSTLLNCRMVCSTWERLSRVRIPAVALIALTPKKIDVRLRREKVPPHSLESYLEYLKLDPRLRFKNFEFRGLEVSDSWSSKFFSGAGSKMDHISLNYLENRRLEWEFDSRTFRHILTNVGSVDHIEIWRLPTPLIEEGFRLSDNDNMIVLKTRTITLNFQEELSQRIKLYYDLLMSAPEMTSLIMYNLIGLQIVGFLADIPAVVGNQLTHIEIKSFEKFPVYEIFPLCGIQLVNLILEFDSLWFYCPHDITIFRVFLKKLAPSIKYLHLKHLMGTRWGSEIFPELPLSFPVLENLLELRLCINQSQVVFNETNVSETFPKLTKGDIITVNYNGDVTSQVIINRN